jgi:GNAT superfamily N-acetyltransferase
MDRISRRNSDLLRRIFAGYADPLPSDQLMIIGADHPSLHEALEEFDAAIGELHCLDPAPFRAPTSDPQFRRSTSLSESFSGFRFAAMLNGRIIAAAKVDENGDLSIAVLPAFRGQGVATQLSVACVARARLHGYHRLTMRSSHRSQRAREVSVAERVLLLDRGKGRIDLMLDYAPVPHSA